MKALPVLIEQLALSCCRVGVSQGAMSVQLVIIADDLTGALDAAAPFAAAGLRVQVATRPSALAAALRQAPDVVAVSTRSREIAPERAMAAVADVLAGLPAGVRLFKKVDSRLKGNVAAELAAFAPGPVLAVPGIPEFGRLVLGGAVCGHGVAVPIPVAAVLGTRVASATIPDTADAQAMVRAVRAAGPGTLIVGARGAAAALAAEMAAGPGADVDKLRLPLLIAVGSTDPITLAQVAALRRGHPDAGYLAAPDGAARDGPGAWRVLLVQAVDGAGADGPSVARALADSVAPLAAAARTLVLTGGATAEAVLDRLGIDVLDLRGEILPGLPVSVAGAWVIVTKSGGFGGEDTLCRLVEGARTE